MNTASLFADPNLLRLESEAMINTGDAPSQRSADATAPFAPKAKENPNEDAERVQLPCQNQRWDRRNRQISSRRLGWAGAWRI
jgi:hypothetical protein